MNPKYYPKNKVRPSTRQQGTYTVSYVAQTPEQKEINLRGIEAARQALKESQSPKD